jgi:hypothetical protein
VGQQGPELGQGMGFQFLGRPALVFPEARRYPSGAPVARWGAS